MGVDGVAHTSMVITRTFRVVTAEEVPLFSGMSRATMSKWTDPEDG